MDLSRGWRENLQVVAGERESRRESLLHPRLSFSRQPTVSFSHQPTATFSRQTTLKERRMG
jgi:hypothetical protein